MARSAMQRQINRSTGINRRSSGAATKSSKKIRNATRRKSRGGQGG